MFNLAGLDRVPPELETGNIEYKERVHPEKLEFLITQMRYRVEQGRGQAFYLLGVADQGEFKGLPDSDFKACQKILTQAADRNEYSLTTVEKWEWQPQLFLGQFSVRPRYHDLDYQEVKIAVAGSVDSGKCLQRDTLIATPSGPRPLHALRVKHAVLDAQGDPTPILQRYEGSGHLFKVYGPTFPPFYATANHILVLHFTPERIIPATLKGFAVWCHRGPYVFQHSCSTLEEAEKIVQLFPTQTLLLSVQLCLNPEVAVKFFRLIDGQGRLHSFKIKAFGLGSWIGLTLAPPHQFQLASGIITHNSSTLGCLTRSVLDDGRGLARLGVFNYPHEIASGRTSSIAHHIMGFDTKGSAVTHVDWTHVMTESDKIISFYDLAGHRKYLKTTITGLTGLSPDYCFIMVGANAGLNDLTQEHLYLCLALKIPFLFLVTKIDMTPPQILTRTLKQLKRFCHLPAIQKVPFQVKDREAVLTVTQRLEDGLIPIFCLSNVTGEGQDLLRLFLFLVPPRRRPPLEKKEETTTYLPIQSTFHVHGIGTVVGGDLEGSLQVGQTVFLGPNAHGHWTTCRVKGIHVNRVDRLKTVGSHYVTAALAKIPRKSIHRGYVLSHQPLPTTRRIEARITVAKGHASTLRQGYQPVLFIRNIRQVATMIAITDKKCNRQPKTASTTMTDQYLRGGDTATVQFRFPRHVYVKVGERLIFSEGQIKAEGVIVKVL